MAIDFVSNGTDRAISGRLRPWVIERWIVITRVRADRGRYNILTVDSQSYGDRPVPVLVMFDLIWSVNIRLDGTDRCLPLRPGYFSKEPLRLLETNPPSTSTVLCVCRTLHRDPCVFQLLRPSPEHNTTRENDY